MYFREIGLEGVEWLDQAQDRGQIVVRCESDDELLGALKCGEFLDQQSNYYVTSKGSAPWG
jgi:hypothetical protein